MFHRFICRCLVMLLGVPLSLLGHDDGTSPPGGTLVLKQKFTFSSKTFKQSLLSVDEYFYLTAPKVGTFAAFDNFECIFSCLRNPSCWSINLAVTKKRDAKIWCKLLSSHKHRFPEEFRENRTSHHIFIMSPCFSSPCHNGGSFMTSHRDHSFQCVCKNGFFGEYCEKAVKSCKEVYDASKSNTSKLVSLHLGSQPMTVLCHMGDFGCGHGGWTPVMKIKGNKSIFHYDSGYWSNNTEYNTAGGETGFDSLETKLPTYKIHCNQY
ncbi:unnamed protein product [Pocillopora meandrina]|uniref:EGF-like domain-containing protein n=1 Tax=Pocillopora meandrina TaxID=46732 RepID=A0AAU9WW81_9CNID|nr:unnamed protein product [Pocillopora meandrina]